MTTKLYDWVAAIDHKLIGMSYLLTGLIFLFIGGAEALLLRTQLAKSGLHVLSPDVYNQIFTMHGTTMIFLVVIPLVLGFTVYLTPLMIGARDMAFPRLNAFGFWLVPFGGLLLYFSFFDDGAPAAGWFAYAPLNELTFSSGSGLTYWALGLLAVGIGTVATGINVIVTILFYRADGMSLLRMPAFAWMSFINSFLILGAMPALNASLVMLLVDRLLGGVFFRPEAGGSALLWQHFFWSFGHPEVYIMVLPAFGIISEVIPTFARRALYGYLVVAGSTVAIAVLSFGVWVHHMFAVGLDRIALYAFAATSSLIAIPTGIKIWNWIATLWGGSIRMTTALLFAAAFLIEFTIGGLSGVMLSVVPIDWQLTDSYFVVAHMHYVLFGGTFFAFMAGFYYWYPKATGRRLSERIGLWQFWLMVVGFNLTFLIQHVLGLWGMPRRVFTYPDLPYWSGANMISTVGAFLLGFSVLVFAWNLWRSLERGAVAGDNPWDGATLEWATTSPPPEDNFSVLPAVHSRHPLWDLAWPRGVRSWPR